MDSPARRSPAMPQDCVWFPSHDPIWISSHVFKIPIHKPKERGLVTKWVSFTPKFKRKEGQIYKLKGHKLGQRIATLLFNYFLLLFPFIWHLNDGSLKIESFFLLFIPRKSYPSPCLYITSTIWWFPIWYIQTASVISRFRHPRYPHLHISDFSNLAGPRSHGPDDFFLLVMLTKHQAALPSTSQHSSLLDPHAVPKHDIPFYKSHYIASAPNVPCPTLFSPFVIIRTAISSEVLSLSLHI